MRVRLNPVISPSRSALCCKLFERRGLVFQGFEALPFWYSSVRWSHRAYAPLTTQAETVHDLMITLDVLTLEVIQ